MRPKDPARYEAIHFTPLSVSAVPGHTNLFSQYHATKTALWLVAVRSSLLNVSPMFGYSRRCWLSWHYPQQQTYLQLYLPIYPDVPYTWWHQYKACWFVLQVEEGSWYLGISFSLNSIQFVRAGFFQLPVGSLSGSSLVLWSCLWKAFSGLFDIFLLVVKKWVLQSVLVLCFSTSAVKRLLMAEVQFQWWSTVTVLERLASLRCYQVKPDCCPSCHLETKATQSLWRLLPHLAVMQPVLTTLMETANKLFKLCISQACKLKKRNFKTHM